MNSVFLDSFVNKPLRESSGSRSSNRFDYQKNWSLCELLSLHAQNSDYLMVFEHHEDVVVFNSETNPNDAIFYQVKTKGSGNWTTGALTKSKSTDGTQSILGKLYSNYLQFPEYINGLVFTSNQGLSAKLKDGTKALELKNILFSNLTSKDKAVICNTVEIDGKKFCDVFGLEHIQFEKNDLRLDDHTAITKGKLVEFFENMHPESEVHISLVYKTFFDEIRRKTNSEHEIKSTTDLYTFKGIKSSEFESMINTVLRKRSDNELWTDASQIMMSEGCNFYEIKQIRSNWQQYIVDMLSVESDYHMQFRETILKILKTEIFSRFDSLCIIVISKLDTEFKSDFSSDYIKAAILYEVIKDDSIQATDSKLKDETK